MALGGQLPVPPIRLGAEAKIGKEKSDIQVKDGDGSRAGKKEGPEGVPVCRKMQKGL